MARLEKAYTSTFGSEPAKGQLYAGFYTLLFGIFVGVVSFVIYLVGNSQAAQQNPSWPNWKEAGYALGALSLPLVFFGGSLALPSKKGLRILGGVGVGLTLLATLVFLYAYPLRFNAADSQLDWQRNEALTAPIVGAYGLGIVAIIVGMFTSIIGYYLDRVQAAAAAAQGGLSEDSAFGYDVPDSVIEKDIEYAMKKYRYAWGEGQTSGAGNLQINIKDEFEAGVTVGGKGVARTVQLDTPQVDEATKMLRGIRPSKDKEMSGDWEQDTTTALLAFRKQKMDQDAVKAATRRRGFWARLWDWLTGRKSGATATSSPAKPAGK